MATIRVKHKNGGYYQLRSSGGVKAYLEGAGNAVAARANATLPERKGYTVSSRQGARRPYGRWRVTVAAYSPHARRSNAKRNTLLRALKG